VILADYRYQYFEKTLSQYLQLVYIKDLNELKRKIEGLKNGISSK